MKPTKQDRLNSLQFLVDKYKEVAIKKLNTTPNIIEAYELYDERMAEAAYFENLLKKEKC